MTETAILSVALGAATLNRANPPSGRRPPAGPYRSFTILKERKNDLSGKLPMLSQLAVLPTCKAFTGTNPKRPVARDKQRSDFAAGEMLTRGRLPGYAPHPIESK